MWEEVGKAEMGGMGCSRQARAPILLHPATFLSPSQKKSLAASYLCLNRVLLCCGPAQQCCTAFWLQCEALLLLRLNSSLFCGDTRLVSLLLKDALHRLHRNLAPERLEMYLLHPDILKIRCRKLCMWPPLLEHVHVNVATKVRVEHLLGRRDCCGNYLQGGGTNTVVHGPTVTVSLISPD